MNEEPIGMKVKAVRQLVERAGYWKCTVTLTTPGRPHKDPTVDVDSNDLEKIPRLGDVLLVYPPRIVGYASERVAQCPSDATACSLIVGYRLENGTDKAELYFLPGRPAQKTLDQMADLISDGWMVSKIIYSDSASVETWQ